MSASFGSSARRRRPISSAKKSFLENNDSYFDSKTKKQLPYLPAIFTWVLLIGLHLGIFLFVHWRVHSFPYQVESTKASLETHNFYENNARMHLETLFSFGPRVTGSKANEIYAKEYIVSVVQKINSDVHPTKKLSIDVQNVSGAFHMENILGTEYYSVYKNLKNIVVKLELKEGVSDNLLINCHYDSATNSPGAGDNAVSCSVMLEILRALSHSDHKLRHGIIFLFNGAEENVLQASHGFITQHPWASSVKAFVNLDSAGAGGWEIVFQTGPEHPWLVRAYAEAAHYPFASVLGQELFQAGIIPSDTDFRIFRDFGKIPGLDIAHVANGYVYHTFNDRIDYIPTGCIQRAGENIMNLLKELASNPKLVDPGLDKHGAMVFFDFVGYFMIHYPQRIGNILNCVVVGFACLSVYMKISKRQSQVSSSLQHLKNIFGAVMVIFSTWIVTMVIIILFGLVLSFGGYSLFWYTNTYNILTVYIIPALIIVLCMHSILKEIYLKTYEPWYLESVFFDASLLIWSMFTVILTYLGVSSAALTMFWVLGPVMFREAAFQLFEKSIYVNTRLFLILHISSLLVPLIITIYALYTICMVFIPILGRSGTIINSEIVMAVIGSACVIIFMQYLVGLVYLCKNIKSVIATLGLVSLIGLLLVLLTPIGFPYSGDKASPSSQRVVALHTNRNFYTKDGSLNKSDSGIWFLPFDHNGAYHLQRHSVLTKAEHPTCEGPYCGSPYKLPLLHLFDVRKTLYQRCERAVVSPKVEVKLVSRESITPDIIRLTFHVTGPDHMTSYIVPADGVSLIKWSLTEDAPKTTSCLPELNNRVYFIYYSHAEEPVTPWEFSVDLKVKTDHGNRAVLDIAFSGQYLHLENSRTKELVEFMESLPDWTVPTLWVGTYDAYQF